MSVETFKKFVRQFFTTQLVALLFTPSNTFDIGTSRSVTAAIIDFALSRIVETSVPREFREICEKVEHLPSCKHRRDRVTSAAVYLRGV